MGEREKVMVSSAVSYRKSTELIGIVIRILDRGMRPTRSLQEPTIFSDKIVPWRLKKILATFWYNKIFIGG